MKTDFKLYIVTERGGKSLAARVSRRDYADAKRALAVASIVAGEPVQYCVRVERWDDGNIFTDVIPSRLGKADRSVIERAVKSCRREVSTAEVTARLRPARTPTFGLFGALA